MLPICNIRKIRTRTDCYWTLEKKKAEEKGTIELYDATFKFYSLMDCLTDTEQNRIYEKAEEYCNQKMSSHEIIRCIMEDSTFLEKVLS